jgi:hypothetical protein
MMLICLELTGNLDLVEPWVMGLAKLWDRNNAGVPEADNLGQVGQMERGHLAEVALIA